MSNAPVVGQRCAAFASSSGPRPHCRQPCSWRTTSSILPDLSFRQGQAGDPISRRRFALSHLRQTATGEPGSDCREQAPGPDPGLYRRAAKEARHVPFGQGAAATWPEEPYVQGRIDGHPGVALRDLEASRAALSRSWYQPNPQKGGYPAPDRVTFLTGPNRDFPKRRRHGRTEMRPK